MRALLRNIQKLGPSLFTYEHSGLPQSLLVSRQDPPKPDPMQSDYLQAIVNSADVYASLFDNDSRTIPWADRPPHHHHLRQRDKR